MATIVNNPAPASAPVYERTDNGLGTVLGLILLVVLLAALFFYGLPAIGSAFRGASNPTVNVPGKIDVNVNNPGAAK